MREPSKEALDAARRIAGPHDATTTEPHECAYCLVLAVAFDAFAAACAEEKWQSVETAPRDDEMFLAITADGRIMIWRGSLLHHQRTHHTPNHLQFPATHWQPLPAPPKV